MRHVAGVAGGRVAAGAEGRLHTRQVRVRLPVVADRQLPGSAANRLIGEVVQSRRRPLLGPSPG